MITIINNQHIPIDVKVLEKNAHTILTHLGYGDFDLGILLTDNKTMHAFNKTYRNQDKPTDILSFPFHTDIEAGDTIEAQEPEMQNLGDIILSPAYIKDDLERWNQSFEERMKVLLVHGVCHLLGYDHIEDQDYTIMHEKEQELLSLL